MGNSPAKSRLVVYGMSFVGVVLIVIVTLASTHKLPFRGQRPETQPRLVNKTNALGIVGVKKLGDSYLEITLLNQSRKAILAYTLVLGDLSVMSYSFSLAPGETRSERVSLHNLESAAANDPLRAGEIVVSAVYLEGGIGEGDTRYLNSLKSMMAGAREQALLALQVLRRANNSGERDSERLLQMVEFQVSALPIKDVNGQPSPDREQGRAWISDKLTKEVKDIRKSRGADWVDTRRQLTDLIGDYERLAAKL